MRELTRTARVTGWFYLGLAVTGLLGSLVVRPRLYDADHPASTLANLAGHDLLARTGVALGLLVVLTQALAAAWFYRLFRQVDAAAALGIAAFGLVNATLLVVDTTFLGTALTAAREPVGDAAATVQTLYRASDTLWRSSGLFFGLWLIPMGWCALRSGWMPRLLGRLLVVGGIGYVVSPIVGFLLPGAGPLPDLLTLPATFGELWMVGYLIIRGVSTRAHLESADGTSQRPSESVSGPSARAVSQA